MFESIKAVAAQYPTVCKVAKYTGYAIGAAAVGAGAYITYKALSVTPVGEVVSEAVEATAEAAGDAAAEAATAAAEVVVETAKSFYSIAKDAVKFK